MNPHNYLDTLKKIMVKEFISWREIFEEFTDDREILDMYLRQDCRHKITENILATSLKDLTEYIYDATGCRVIVLIDEYDKPITCREDDGFRTAVRQVRTRLSRLLHRDC